MAASVGELGRYAAAVETAREYLEQTLGAALRRRGLRYAVSFDAPTALSEGGYVGVETGQPVAHPIKVQAFHFDLTVFREGDRWCVLPAVLGDTESPLGLERLDVLPARWADTLDECEVQLRAAAEELAASVNLLALRRLNG